MKAQKSLGEQLHYARKKQKLSMRYVARIMKFSVIELSKIEHDEIIPSPENLEKLKSILLN